MYQGVAAYQDCVCLTHGVAAYKDCVCLIPRSRYLSRWCLSQRREVGGERDWGGRDLLVFTVNVTNLESSGKTEPQLRNCLDPISLCRYL